MEYLIINAMSPNQDLLINELLQLAAKHQCNIQDGRLTSLGSEYALHLLIAGNWSAIAKLESALAALKEKEEITLGYKRTVMPVFEDQYLPYIIQVVGLDLPQLVFEISNFFSTQGIRLNDLQTNPFRSSYTETAMTTVNMAVSIPAKLNIADLRERFILLCDELNVDGILEPEKR